MVWLAPERSEVAGPSVVAEGILARTPIATPNGWIAAESLTDGAFVLTFDCGHQPVVQTRTQDIADAPPELWPLQVPAWAMDNREELLLLPEQRVLIEADLAEDMYGDPFAMIPARALEGWRGIARCRPPETGSVINLRFARHQVIYASRGVLLSCSGDPLANSDWRAAPFSNFTFAQARHLIACLMAEETGAALRSAGRHCLG